MSAGVFCTFSKCRGFDIIYTRKGHPQGVSFSGTADEIRTPEAPSALRAPDARPAPAARNRRPWQKVGASMSYIPKKDTHKGCPFLVRLTGFEPPTFGSGGQRSIQLSYSRMLFKLMYYNSFQREYQVPGGQFSSPFSDKMKKGRTSGLLFFSDGAVSYRGCPCRGLLQIPGGSS